MRYAFVLVLLFGGAILALLATGNRVLVREEFLAPGTYYTHPQSGESFTVGKSGSFACHYFTGRSVLTAIFYYSSSNMFGKDSCPFLFRQN